MATISFESALKAGAGLAVVAKGQEQRFPGAPLLIVPDVLEALRNLARAARARMRAQVIAVTGSVGKTGTKDALRLALSADGETHASTSSYNNHWGVPLSLARCPANAKYAVFEIGMNHADEITPLTKLVRPHVAIITTIEPVHLEYFGSLEKIADAKAEIFAGIESGGTAVLNRDNGQYERLAAAAQAAGIGRIVSFGEKRRRRCAVASPFAAGRLFDDRGPHTRAGRHLQAGRAGPASCAQFTCCAGRGLACRGGSRAVGTRSQQSQARQRARSADSY